MKINEKRRQRGNGKAKFSNFTAAAYLVFNHETVNILVFILNEISNGLFEIFVNKCIKNIFI